MVVNNYYFNIVNPRKVTLKNFEFCVLSRRPVFSFSRELVDFFLFYNTSVPLREQYTKEDFDKFDKDYILCAS